MNWLLRDRDDKAGSNGGSGMPDSREPGAMKVACSVPNLMRSMSVNSVYAPHFFTSAEPFCQLYDPPGCPERPGVIRKSVTLGVTSSRKWHRLNREDGEWKEYSGRRSTSFPKKKVSLLCRKTHMPTR